jgi:hypothetical protein
MDFNDQARKLAQQEAKQQASDKQDLFVEVTAAVHREQYEQWRSDCKEKVGKWFDGVGMLPHPPHSTGKISSRQIPYSDSSESCMEITWEFAGYQYRAACKEDPESLPTVEICIEDHWLPGNTKAEIGRALRQKGQPLPRKARLAEIPPERQAPRNTPTLPPADLSGQ